MHDTGPHYGAIHSHEILPLGVWHITLAFFLVRMSVQDLTVLRWGACPSRTPLTRSSRGKGCCWSHSLKKIPPKMHHLEALLFPQLLSSCYSKFLAGFIFASPAPQVISKPSHFLKMSFVTSLLSPALMCLAQSRCVQQSWSPGPASGSCWLPKAVGSLAAEYLQTACHKQLMPK